MLPSYWPVNASHAVGREAGEHLEAGVAGQPPGDAALGRDAVQIARIRENDLIAMDRRKSQQPSLVIRTADG